MVEITGTFLGHVVLGCFFVAWGLAWVVEETVRGDRSSDTPVERNTLVPALKVVLPLLVAGLIEAVQRSDA